MCTILNQIKDLMGAAIPSSSWKVGKELCDNPKTSIEGRLAALKYLSKVSNKLEETNRRWVASLPQDSPSKQLNFALIKFLCSHLDYPDKSLPKDLANGMPVVGEYRNQLYSANARARLVRRCQNGAKACFPETLKWWEGPSRVPALGKHVFVGKRPCGKWQKVGRRNLRQCLMKSSTRSPISHRFAMDQGPEEDDAKIRVIDDFRASKVNDMLSMGDTAVPQNLDVVFGIASMFTQLGCARPLRACVVDFAHAYKHVGIPAPQYDFASIVLPNASGTPMVASLRTHPFGSSRAPANWARVTNFVQFILLRLRKVWLVIYVGDCFCVEPADTIDSESNCIRAACALFGLELEPAK